MILPADAFLICLYVLRSVRTRTTVSKSKGSHADADAMLPGLCDVIHVIRYWYSAGKGSTHTFVWSKIMVHAEL